MNSVSTEVDVMQDTGVKRAWDKWQKFNGDLADLERRIAETNSSLTSLHNEGRSRPLDQAAETLVAGKKLKDIDGDIAVLQGEYPKLCKRRSVVARAVEIQKNVFKKEEARASREICERIEPEYKEIVTRLAKTLIALGKAKMADIAFFDALTDGGVMHGTLRRMNVTALGEPYDRNGRFAQFFMEAIAFGLIDESIVPQEWRERWR